MTSPLGRLVGLALCLAVLASGCSYGKARREDVSVGDGVPQQVTRDESASDPSAADPASPAATSAPEAPPAPTAPPAAGARKPANQGVRSYPSGWKLTLTVNGQLDYKHSEDILLEVVARNDGQQALQYDPNDLRHFAIIPAGGAKGRTWYDTDCRPKPAEVVGGAITLEPGEEATFQATYPGPGVDGSNEGCRLDPGDYDVGGLVAWCPPGTIRSDGTCDPARRDVVASGAVRIQITA
ncbi:MAG TPA: hypothetical protein VMY88_10845 [Acidimicrobiales bacterium]|nr:hypothetical protein [Acidimicrobiales bacterium]